VARLVGVGTEMALYANGTGTELLCMQPLPYKYSVDKYTVKRLLNTGSQISSMIF